MNPRLLTTVVLTLSAAAAGFFGYRAMYGETAPAEVVPAQRPVFELADLGGEMRSITEWDGQPLIVNFWATWCGPCRREIPLLQSLHEEYAAQGLRVIGIAIDDADAAREYIASMGVDYAILVGELDASEAMSSFGARMSALPFTVFVDRDSRIVRRHTGELHRPEALEGLAEIL